MVLSKTREMRSSYESSEHQDEILFLQPSRRISPP